MATVEMARMRVLNTWIECSYDVWVHTKLNGSVLLTAPKRGRRMWFVICNSTTSARLVKSVYKIIDSLGGSRMNIPAKKLKKALEAGLARYK